MTNKEIIIFFVGGIAGLAGGILGTRGYFKKKYEAMADAEINEMAAYYEEKDKLRQEYVPAVVEGLYDGMNAENKEEKRERLKAANNREKVDYTSMYEKNPENVEEDGREKTILYADDKPVAEFYYEGTDDSAEEEREAHDEHQKNKDRPPKIIAAESLGDVPSHYDEKTLLYYMYDEVLIDEDDNVIENPELFIGDALDKYGFRSNDEMMIFVQNFAHSTVYELQKVMASYSDEYGEE